MIKIKTLLKINSYSLCIYFFSNSCFATGYPVFELVKSAARFEDMQSDAARFLSENAHYLARQKLESEFNQAQMGGRQSNAAIQIRSITESDRTLYNLGIANRLHAFPDACDIYSATQGFGRAAAGKTALLESSAQIAAKGGTPPMLTVEGRRESLISKVEALQTQLNNLPPEAVEEKDAVRQSLIKLKQGEGKVLLDSYQRILKTDIQKSKQNLPGFQASTLLAPVYPAWFINEIGAYKLLLSGVNDPTRMTNDSLHGTRNETPIDQVERNRKWRKYSVVNYSLDYLTSSRLAFTGDKATKENLAQLYPAEVDINAFKNTIGIGDSDNLSEHSLVDSRLKTPFLKILSTGLAKSDAGFGGENISASNTLLQYQQIALMKAAKAYAHTKQIEMLELRLVLATIDTRTP